MASTTPLLPVGSDEDRSTCAVQVLMPSFGCYVIALVGAAIIGLAYQHITHHVLIHPPWMYMLPWEILAWIAAIIATLNSCHHIYQHLTLNTNSRKLKSTVLPILLVIPVYTICSVLALTSEQSTINAAMLLNAFREFYEGVVLVAFMQFIAEFWGGTKGLASKVATDEMTLHNVVPGIADKLDTLLPCFKACCVGHSFGNLRVFPFQRAPGSEYVGWSFVGVLQYAFIMWLLLLVNLVLWRMSDDDRDLSGIAVIGHITPEKIMKGIKIASNLWAMYNLLIMFEYLRESKETEERMNRIKPLHKFTCIKLIVLFSLWQESALQALAKLGMLPTMVGVNETWEDQRKQADAAINFLVCIEMLMFAQWHRYAYPYYENWECSDPVEPYQPRNWLGRNFPPFKMVDDILYLLVKRVPGQMRAVKLLEKATHEELVSADGELARELNKEFNYFDLNNDGEAGVAQIQIVLVRSGRVNWQQAHDMLVKIDKNKNERISREEFNGLTRTLPRTS